MGLFIQGYSLMPEIILKPKEAHRVSGGHLWIFSNEIQSEKAVTNNGQIVVIKTSDGAYIGTGYYNRHSLIAARILTRNQNEQIDHPFFLRRIQKALAYRKRIFPDQHSYRVVFGESDLLPGLIVDKYDNYLAVQITTLGMELQKTLILEVLKEVLSPEGIILRNDVSLRALEGLPEEIAVVDGTVPAEIIIEEQGLKFMVDLHHGQKTGFFFDQRENRLGLSSISNLQNAHVLDCFCYCGAWALAAAKLGAQKVIGIDESKTAIALATKNARINEMSERSHFVVGEVFLELGRLVNENQKFSCVILDPPAFAKSKKDVAAAFRAYTRLNRLALKLIQPEGFLITSSCSWHISAEDFLAVLRRAAREARRDARLWQYTGQAKDHPVLLAMPETAYLKCAFLQVM